RILAYRLAQVRAELAAPRWADAQSGLPTVAYLSPEFGLAASVPQYSGGLGVLAGDHLKSASELGLPLVGVGLLYRNGYFQQYLSADGWQQEAYPELDFYNLAIEPLKYTDGTPIQVRVDLPDNAVFVKVWKAMVG
ncbi:MAG TPA: glycogen/starch/alpha-glucan phosphorylase, partial [Tepidisphaeraceae bacterium]|nr:glycogen/starch/alpha-glucan phosphorylase [Tepidisphaeraceae bacterium]